jgi:hypothetical protein
MWRFRLRRHRLVACGSEGRPLYPVARGLRPSSAINETTRFSGNALDDESMARKNLMVWAQTQYVEACSYPHVGDERRVRLCEDNGSVAPDARLIPYGSRSVNLFGTTQMAKVTQKSN